MENEALQSVFASLKAMLAKHATPTQGFVVVHDTANQYSINEAAFDAKGKPIFFGMVKIGAGKVAFHLMPVYEHPSLLANISPELKKRMQGKSCFNFNRIEPTLLKELEGVVKASTAATKT
jgi:hypothetical protein